MPYADPIARRRVQREAQRRRRSRQAGVERPAVNPSTHGGGGGLTPGEVGAMLREELSWLRQATVPGDGERCRIVAHLCTVALRAFEAADLIGRVERIEAALEERGDRPAAHLRLAGGGL